VELTEIRTGGQDWWTLGFEVTGPADALRSELQGAGAVSRAAWRLDQAGPERRGR
jgi:hypothetical protein